MSLHDALAKTLGVVPSSAPPPPKTTAGTGGWAPPRPDPQYEYIVYLERKQYCKVFVAAANEDEAKVIAEDDVHESDWYDSSDQNVTDVDYDGVKNQAELDEWDETYGDKYDTDGEPKCSDCGCCMHESLLTEIADDSNAWYCDDCLANN